MSKVAIVLAAGQGKRMNSDVAKQYLEIAGRPVLYYSLAVFEQSIIDAVIIVTGTDEEEYIQKEFVEKYDFKKVKAIVCGGKERYHSVANGISAISQSILDCEYVFIHDGARPFVNHEMIERAYEEVKVSKACVVGMPVKDTIKIADEEGYIVSTPKRNLVWAVQTPQVFEYSLIKDAYEQLIQRENDLLQQGTVITDDGMVVEMLTGKGVKLVEGDYKNIKITTPSDMQIAEVFTKSIKR